MLSEIDKEKAKVEITDELEEVLKNKTKNFGLSRCDTYLSRRDRLTENREVLAMDLSRRDKLVSRRDSTAEKLYTRF